jgi:hypothetical protein
MSAAVPDLDATPQAPRISAACHWKRYEEAGLADLGL